MTKKLRVGVIFGGRSGEHAVSLMSARFVLNSLDPKKYKVTQIGITQDGRWLAGGGVWGALKAEEFEGLTTVSVLADPSRHELTGFTSTLKGELINKLAEIDVYFPVLHGTFGEDGTLQGLFELADVAYVGAGVLGSAVGMDKGVFFEVMRANGIPVVETVVLLRSEIKENIVASSEKAEQAGDYPLFIKPANLGSSVGVSKATSRSDLVEGLMEAADYDRRIVVQKGINGREIEVSVLGNDDPQASVCGEIRPEAEFYTYEAKYHDDRSKAFIPADIPKAVSERIRELAVKAFKAIDVAGLARVDFFLENDTGNVYLNELNTMPGFTDISMYPMLWEESGISGRDLVDRLIELALERKEDRDITSHEYRRSGE